MGVIQLYTNGQGTWYNISEEIFDKDGYLAAFTSGGKHFVLKRDDMNNREWGDLFFRTASVGGAGWFLGGPFGAFIGGVAGFVKFLSDRPEEGYYDVHSKEKKPLISGKISKHNLDQYRQNTV